ncbi:MAG TPA: zinc ribbon domain-containing protein [Terracidiphilus sp.]|nr:zinc ribbon domain-containing protein [Terracidiphilus sp.]
MELTCPRCHNPLLADHCFCPTCGLPLLVYETEAEAEPGQVERWTHAVRDASIVEWKPAMRVALALAVPAGLLSSGISPVSLLGLLWVAGAAAWAVVLYVRSQRPAWITVGAGARIGLVTGLLAGWLAFTVSGGALYVQRNVLHQSGELDTQWKSYVSMSQQMSEQWAQGMTPADAKQAQVVRAQVQAWMLSPWGHAGIEAFSLIGNALFLVFFAVGGGAIGARVLARTQRPQL